MTRQSKRRTLSAPFLCVLAIPLKFTGDYFEENFVEFHIVAGFAGG
jgi:hypothetical protein